MKLIVVSAFAVTLFAFIKPALTDNTKKLVTVTSKTDSAASAVPSPIAGLWIGEYNCPQIPEQGSRFYSLVIYPDGVLLTKGKGGDDAFYYATGTWTLSQDSVFTGTITSFVTPGPNPVTQTIQAIYHTNGELTNGTWKDIDNPNGGPLEGNLSVMRRVK